MKTKIVFANFPWWVALPPAGSTNPHTGQPLMNRTGVRAGSRWPFTIDTRSVPNHPNVGEYMPYPFFMGYACTYAARHIPDAQCYYRDSIACRESYDSFFHYVQERRPEWMVVESATPCWQHDQDIISRLAQYFPSLKIIVTGPITTTRHEEILGTAGVVAAVRGEYEKGVVRVIRDGETGLIEHDLLTVEEMNAAPWPYMDPWMLPLYLDRNPYGTQHPQLQVWSSRGCPYKCIFCSWPATMTGNDPDGTKPRSVRHYTPEYMLAYLRDCKKRFPEIQSIYFDDDTFNLGNKHVENMCEVMAKIDLPWSAMCRADTCTHEHFRMMRDAGCFGVKFGFESGVQRIVDEVVGKKLNLERARETVFFVKSLGMSVHGTFTYGLPGETQEDRQQTRRFIESLPIDTYQESGTGEIDGTPLDTLKKGGALPKHSGAVIDENYTKNASTDGNAKFEQNIAKTL